MSTSPSPKTLSLVTQEITRRIQEEHASSDHLLYDTANESWLQQYSLGYVQYNLVTNPYNGALDFNINYPPLLEQAAQPKDFSFVAATLTADHAIPALIRKEYLAPATRPIRDFDASRAPLLQVFDDSLDGHDILKICGGATRRTVVLKALHELQTQRAHIQAIIDRETALLRAPGTSSLPPSLSEGNGKRINQRWTCAQQDLCRRNVERNQNEVVRLQAREESIQVVTLELYDICENMSPRLLCCT